MSYTYDILRRYKSRGAIIGDTNLMLLLILGSNNIQSIGHGRIAKYVENDYHLMMRIYRLLDRIIITPNIATEVDNLARQDAPDKSALAGAVRRILSKVSEVYRPTQTAANAEEYEKIGLTDVAAGWVGADLTPC